MYIKYWILNACDVCIIFHSILVDSTSSVCNVWKTFQTKWRLIRWIELSACHFSACIQKFCQFNSEMSLKRMKESKELNFSLSSLSKGMFARILSVWSVFVPLGNCSSGLFCQKFPAGCGYLHFSRYLWFGCILLAFCTQSCIFFHRFAPHLSLT